MRSRENKGVGYNGIYNTATSCVSGLDESIQIKSCPLGTTRRVTQEKSFPERLIINPVLNKLGRSKRLDIELVRSLRVY